MSRSYGTTIVHGSLLSLATKFRRIPIGQQRIYSWPPRSPPMLSVKTVAVFKVNGEGMFPVPEQNAASVHSGMRSRKIRRGPGPCKHLYKVHLRPNLSAAHHQSGKASRWSFGWACYDCVRNEYLKSVSLCSGWKKKWNRVARKV